MKVDKVHGASSHRVEQTKHRTIQAPEKFANCANQYGDREDNVGGDVSRCRGDHWWQEAQDSLKNIPSLMTEIEGCLAAENDMPVENSLPGDVSSVNVSLVQIDLECNSSNFTREALVQRFGIEKIFLFAPVYDCREYPVLAIYEVSIVDVNLERRLDDCPAARVSPTGPEAENQGNQ